MIVAAGLSPAWQQILLFDRFATGAVNGATEAHWCGSGKVLNVGISLSQLGAECRTIALLGGPRERPSNRNFARAANRYELSSPGADASVYDDS